MSTPRFHSILAPAFNSFITFKQVQGYDYSHAAKHLQPLDQFLCQRHFDQPYLTTAIVQAYVTHSQAWAPTTRYTRLTAARTFARDWRQEQPASYLWHERPVKRVLTRRFYLYDDHEIQALMHQAQGLRPASSLRPHTHTTLIGLLAVTGLRIQEALDLDLGDWNPDDRVQEFVDLDVTDLRLHAPTQVLLTGKGQKQRLVPLWANTVKALEHYLDFRRRHGIEHPRLFLNARREPMTRWGINYLIDKYHDRAAHACPALTTKHVTPHTFRHTTALHLIQSGVDLSTVQEWLGHADQQTTHEDAHINMDMKRQALESCASPSPPSTPQPQEPEWLDSDTLNFLDELTHPRTLCEATSGSTPSVAAD